MILLFIFPASSSAAMKRKHSTSSISALSPTSSSSSPEKRDNSSIIHHKISRDSRTSPISQHSNEPNSGEKSTWNLCDLLRYPLHINSWFYYHELELWDILHKLILIKIRSCAWIQKTGSDSFSCNQWWLLCERQLLTYLYFIQF